MKLRWNPVLISALLQSLCLLSFLPGGLRMASTWKQAYIDTGLGRESNLLAPLGFLSITLVCVGMIVLWTGYRKQEKWAYAVMVLLLFGYEFPITVLPALVSTYSFSDLLQSAHADFLGSMAATGIFAFVVMTIALLLPVKSFIGSRRAD